MGYTYDLGETAKQMFEALRKCKPYIEKLYHEDLEKDTYDKNLDKTYVEMLTAIRDAKEFLEITDYENN